MEIRNSQWVTVSRNIGDIAPVFRRAFDAEKAIEKATLEITALGVYSSSIFSTSTST